MKNTVIYKIIRDFYDYKKLDTYFLLANEVDIRTLPKDNFESDELLFSLLTFFEDLELEKYSLLDIFNKSISELFLEVKIENDLYKRISNLATKENNNVIYFVDDLYRTIFSSGLEIEICNCMFLIILNIYYYYNYKKFLHISFREMNELNTLFSDINLVLFNDKFTKILEKNNKYLAIYKQYTIEEIINKINCIPSIDLKLLNIKKIYLYGSLIRKINNVHSDIDMHVVLSKKGYDLNVSAINIKKYFDLIFPGANFDVTTTFYDKNDLSKATSLFFGDEIEII